MKTRTIKIATVLIFTLGMSALTFAQTGPPISGPGPGGCFPPPCIPIDGGLSLIIAAGIGLASKKAYDHHKES